MTPLVWRDQLSRWRYAPWLAALGYLLLALYMTAPIHDSFSTRFLGGATSDVYEMARHIWWYKTALQTGADIFQHSLLGYPDGFPALQLWAHPLQFFPMWLFAFAMPLAAAYNLGIILTLTLNGWSMYLLARRRIPTDLRWPAFFAGLVYMTFPIMQGHLFDGHAGLLAQWPLPLCILWLFDYAEHGGKRRFMIGALLFFTACLGNSLQVIYAMLPLSIGFCGARLLRRDQVGAARGLAMCLAGCALLLLFLSLVIGNALDNPEFVGAGGHIHYSIDLLGLASPSFGNPFWGDIATHSRQVLGTNLGEGYSYVGVIGGFLALLGIVTVRGARWWLLLAFVAWLLALGPLLNIHDQVVSAPIAGYETVVPLPYALLIDLPLFELARAPGHFLFLFAAMFAMMTGYGAKTLWSSRLLQRRSRVVQTAAAIALALLLVGDYRLFPTFPSVAADLPPAIHDLSSRSDIRAIYNAPHDDLLAPKQAMYLQTAHGKPLIAGHDARVTPVDQAKLSLLSSFEASLLWEAGADIVIVHKGTGYDPRQLADLLASARQQLGEPIYDDSRFSVYETPFSRRTLPVLQTTQTDENTHTTHIYKAQPGWLEFNATLEAVNRRVNLSLNGTLLDSLEVNGKIPLSLPLPIARRGYHSLLIELDPPCPPRIDASLLFCHSVTVELVDIRVLSTGTIYDPIRIEDDIVLAGYYLPDQADDELAVRFWWRFEAPRSANDVRFVHLVDEAGRLVPGRQDDTSFGSVGAGDELTETVRFDTRFLPAGEYRVLTGWYRLPDAIRYDVLTNVPGAQDDTIQLGVRARR